MQRSSKTFIHWHRLTYLSHYNTWLLSRYEGQYLFLRYTDYETTHKAYSLHNKKVIGKFKDELNGRFVNEFVGLKAKMYSMKSEDGEK